MGGDLAPSLGGRKTKFRELNFRMTSFMKNFPFLCQKFLMTTFSHWSCFVCLLPVSTLPIFAEKPLFQNKTFLHDTFFSQFLLCHASNNATSPNIGGWMHGPSPQSPPKSIYISIPSRMVSIRRFFYSPSTITWVLLSLEPDWSGVKWDFGKLVRT